MYLISHKLKFIFFHTPKTGGLSIFETLKKYGIFICRQRDFIIRNLRKIIVNNYRIGLYEYHIPASKMKLTFDPIKWDEYFKFGFVRNPYRWVHSYYQFIRMTSTHRRYIRFQAFKDIDHFVSEVRMIEPEIPRQANYLTDMGNNLLVDFIGHYENINKDFSMVLSKLSLSENIKLPHLNKSDRIDKPVIEIFSKQSIRTINDYFNRDFLIFNYPKIHV